MDACALTYDKQGKLNTTYLLQYKPANSNADEWSKTKTRVQNQNNYFVRVLLQLEWVSATN